MHLLMQDIGNDARPDARARRARVRRGAGQLPGETPDVSRVIEPLLSKVLDQVAPYDHQTFDDLAYIIAPLYALHPQAVNSGTMGTHFRQLVGAGDVPASVERRFVALLGTGPEELPDVLRQAVLLLRAQVVPINWPQLFADLVRWSRSEIGHIQVQRAWARDFWRETTLDQQAPTDIDPDNGDVTVASVV
jgi:CRISPR type I-E-associated protein CasB/Cse2